jgi:hypothetical protein
MLLGSGAASASEFMELCEAARAKADILLAECKSDARPFKRNFYPGGRGEAVPEEHRAWFLVAYSTPHFGFGCVLGPKEEVRFLGLYYFLKAENFQQANSAPFVFVDFNGNAGLRTGDGKMFVLLAAHRLTPPGREPSIRDGNCEIGRLEDSKITINKPRDWYQIHKVDVGPPLTVTYCLDRKIRFESDQCFTQEVRSFVNETASRIIYGKTSIVISEEGRMFVGKEIVHGICERQTRPLLEYFYIVKEACEYRS